MFWRAPEGELGVLPRRVLGNRWSSVLESLVVEAFYTALLVLGALGFAATCGYAVYRLVKS